MTKLKLALLAIAVAGLSFGIAACCGDDDDDEAPPEVAEASFDLTVGNLVPLTGALNEFGPPGEKAADLAVEQANAALQEVTGGDITVSLETSDTETRPAAGQSAAEALIADGATCIAGAWASDVTIPTARTVTSRQQIPQISPASTSPEITDLPDDGFLFRTAPSDALQGQVLADAAAEQFGADATVATAARNDAYGEGIIRQFEDAWEGEVTAASPILYDPELPSYTSEANQIVSDNPDGFVIVDFEEPYNRLGAALARTGDFEPENLLTADGLAFTELPGTIPDPALDGASGTRPSAPEGTETVEAFDQLFTDAPGPGRQTFDANNFDAVLMCVLAAVAAGSNEGPAIQEQLQAVSGPEGEQYDYTQLADAIQALRDGDEIDFEGVSGPIDFDDNGDPGVAFYDLWHYEGGELVVDETVEREVGD
jgi:ABC-type branched-subunit amino acid transport system substrate-binding protein